MTVLSCWKRRSREEILVVWGVPLVVSLQSRDIKKGNAFMLAWVCMSAGLMNLFLFPPALPHLSSPSQPPLETQAVIRIPTPQQIRKTTHNQPPQTPQVRRDRRPQTPDQRVRRLPTPPRGPRRRRQGLAGWLPGRRSPRGRKQRPPLQGRRQRRRRQWGRRGRLRGRFFLGRR